ncbi:hypothetical protein PG988_000166 [Apiospora saccharicola]
MTKPSLPPQTTLFAATVKTCQQTSIWCPVYPSSGVACYAGGFSETAGTCHGLFYMDKCYPTEYGQIFSSVGTWGESSGWAGGEGLNFHHLIPSQRYEQEALWSGGITPTRICTSQAKMGGSPSKHGAAAASAIILGPSVSVAEPSSLLSSSSAAAAAAAVALPTVVTVFHPVFPLRGQDLEDPGGGDPGGLRLGVGIGVPLGALLGLSLVTFYLMRRWQRKRQTPGPDNIPSDKGNSTAKSNGGEMAADTPRGFDGKAELPAISLSELPGLDIPRELLGDDGAIEIGSQPRNELEELPGRTEGHDALTNLPEQEHSQQPNNMLVGSSTQGAVTHGVQEVIAELP